MIASQADMPIFTMDARFRDGRQLATKCSLTFNIEF